MDAPEITPSSYDAHDAQAGRRRAGRVDGSWCIGEEGEFPDLVLEIALTTGLKKLEIYRRFAVPEVWFWRRGKLEIFILKPDASGYDPASGSRLLPSLAISLLERCALIRNWQEARRTFRAGLPPTG